MGTWTAGLAGIQVFCLLMFSRGKEMLFHMTLVGQPAGHLKCVCSYSLSIYLLFHKFTV